MADAAERKRFEDEVLAHLDAGYNLARWLLRDAVAAEDVVQDASLRAFRFFGARHGASPKAWFLAIVRNACMDWFKAERSRAHEESYDEDLHGVAARATLGLEPPDAAALRESDARTVREAILALPPEYREVIVLREFEELSYKEISAVVGCPMGTVMSRIARGRDQLQARLVRNPARKCT